MDYKEVRKSFMSLPERAQEIWFQYCEESYKKNDYDNLLFPNIYGFDRYTYCESPIEVILGFAYDLVLFDEGSPDIFLQPQYEVSIDGSKFRLDFAFIAEDSELIDFKNNDFKLAIECDGHEFHERTKEQVVRDNEREYLLKMDGFEVLRFSGSQIYNKPFRCARQIYDYISSRVKGEDVNG